MNIEDIKKPDSNLAGDRLDLIFEKQRNLMQKYQDIEKANGCLYDENIPVNIDTTKGQARLKDFLWRTTEELGEALHATSLNHIQEEISDAFHFLIELILLSGCESKITPPQKTSSGTQDKLELFFDCSLPHQSIEPDIQVYTMSVISNLAMAGNCLKQKPWKQSHMLTDKNKYYQYILNSFISFVHLCISQNLTAEDLYTIYYQKNEVNQFRIKSNY